MKAGGVSRVGLIAALPFEAAALDPIRELPNAIIVSCGPGREAARAAAAWMSHQRVGLLISWGSAAGLVPSLRAGDVLLSSSVFASDGSQIGGSEHRLSALAGRLESAGLNTRITTLAEADEVLRDAESKRCLAAGGAAEAADMESAAIAEVAFAAGIDWLAVRVVVDDARTRLPAAALRGWADGRMAPGRVAAGLLQSPADWPATARLARDWWRCRRSLRRCAQALRPALG